MILKIESSCEPFGRHRIGVHRDDVLKAILVRTLRAQLERFGHLPFVDAVEQVAVMNQKTRPTPLLRANPRQHQVKAEDLHVRDSLTALAGDMHLELRSAGRVRDGQASRAFVERPRQLFEAQNCITNDVTPVRGCRPAAP